MRSAAVAVAVLACACLASAHNSAWEDWSSNQRSLLATSTQTVQVGMASSIDPGSKIQICKVDVSKRASCGDLLGNPVYCPVTPGKGGMVNFTVNQGDTLQVNFEANSSLVLIGGAQNGGFAETAPCQVEGQTATATAQPIASTSITGFTFQPTRAYCPSFQNGTQGTLAVYVFDTSDGSMEGSDYYASACTFSINLTIQPGAAAPLVADQFYTASAGNS